MEQPADKTIKKGFLTFKYFSEKLIDNNKKIISKEVQRQKILLQHIAVTTHVVLLKRARMPELTHSFMEE
jgi:hypothetical protein